MTGRKHLLALTGLLMLGAVTLPVSQASQPRVIMIEDFGYHN